MKTNLSSFSYSDKETLEGMKILYDDFNYVADPHGAIGYLAAKAYQKKQNDHARRFLETAHPTKFLDVVKQVIPNHRICHHKLRLKNHLRFNL